MHTHLDLRRTSWKAGRLRATLRAMHTHTLLHKGDQRRQKKKKLIATFTQQNSLFALVPRYEDEREKRRDLINTFNSSTLPTLLSTIKKRKKFKIGGYSHFLTTVEYVYVFVAVVFCVRYKSLPPNSARHSRLQPHPPRDAHHHTTTPTRNDSPKTPSFHHGD